MPEGPPESIEVRPISGDSIMVLWSSPIITNGEIVSYQIYFKRLDFKAEANSLIRLIVQKDATRNFVYNLTKLGKSLIALYQFKCIRCLEPSTSYQIQLSASTNKGESDKSTPLQVTTDYAGTVKNTLKQTIIY